MNYEALDEALDYLNNSEKLEEIVIGTIDFNSDECLDESKIGKLNFGSTKGTCEIRILPREGINYPHFHIESKKGPDESVCIGIYAAEYYKHSHGKATLNSGEIKVLNKWLDQKSKISIEILNKDGKKENVTLTNWQYIAYDYDNNNFTSHFNYNTASRPEYYSNMPDMKDPK